MSQIMDPRLCESAYVTKITIYPNNEIQVPESMAADAPIVTKYFHQVCIQYERKDKSGTFLGYKTIGHDTALVADMDAVSEINTAVDKDRYEWIRADKLILTGTDIGPESK